jgi:hypothetical protein
MLTHNTGLAVATLLGLASLLPNQAHAGLLSSSATVQAVFHLASLGNAENEIPVGGIDGSPTSLAAPVDYQSGTHDLATIHVGDTQIVITNLSAGIPFCSMNSVGTACTDPFDGFDFKFTGEDILGVSVDPSSAPGFQPVNGTFQGNAHLGLQLLSNNLIRVDVTGDLPSFNDQLVLDLSFADTTNPPPADVVEPATLAVLGSGLAVVAASRRRGRARS